MTKQGNLDIQKNCSVLYKRCLKRYPLFNDSSGLDSWLFHLVMIRTYCWRMLMCWWSYWIL